jgi:hypothetical protein
MSEPENFLSRWSRRKRESGAPDAEPADSTPNAHGAGPQDKVPRAEETEPAVARDAPATEASAPRAAAAPEPFDLSSLPSLESITAQTDIRPFLQPGVPGELRRAALRRVWSADPAIRDFIGLADYAWDFTAPGGMAGFGPLDAGHNVTDLLARAVGELAQPRPDETRSPPALEKPPHSAAESGAPGSAGGEQGAPAGDAATGSNRQLVQREENTAGPQDLSDTSAARPKVPRAGGALPKMPQAT